MVVNLNSKHLHANLTGPQPPLGRTSFILHERGRQHHWEGTGALSIKTFSGGRAIYDVGAGRYAVDESSYLILNHGQPYSISVESQPKLESFCIFFETGLAEDVHRSLTTATNHLLDEPEMPSVLPVHFFERTYRHDDLLSPALIRLRATLAQRKEDRGWIKEQLHVIIERMLQVHRNVYKEVETLPAVRAGTREELYRRLHRARDYIAASLDQPVTLDELARVACLSPNHFLRTFKQVFRQTPHQYLTSLRLERARELLVKTDRPVTDICLDVGFESLGSFSWLFRQRLGISPDNYRRQKR
jgi:AraC-like DNA-binding protein